MTLDSRPLAETVLRIVRFVIQEYTTHLYLSRMDKRIVEVIRYIEENLDEAFSLDELASIACLSPSQFHRVFKKATHKTPFKYIEDLKMGKAYKSILVGTESINEITLNLGYRDYETFSRAFKRKYIFSPDDLKSLLDKIHNTSEGIQKEDIHIVSLNIEDEREIIQKIQELVDQKDISPEDLKASKIFKISKKSDTPSNDHILIKNKFELKEETNIKKSLLK